MEERLKILEMLRDGIISIEEAGELLKTIDNKKVTIEEEGKVKTVTEKEILLNKKLKMLKIKVDSAEGDKVNINIPISFLKAAIASGSIDNIYSKSFNIKGVNNEFIKDSIDLDLLISCIENDFVGDLIDVESSEGDKVHIYFE